MAMNVTYQWSEAAGTIDGTDTITGMGMSTMTNIPLVEVSKTLQGDGTYEFTDNRGHTLIGIERLDTSKYADVLDIEYSLADSCYWLSSGYILEVRTYGGDDIIKIGNTMPSDYDGYPRPGAKVIGGAGNDRITGGDQNDYLTGDVENSFDNATGNDTIWGGNGHDRIDGDAGNDKLYGGDGDDTIVGDTGYVYGKDKITGGHGADIIVGCADGKADIVYYNETADSTKKSYDRITSFDLDVDTIDLHLIDANTHKANDQAFKLVKHLSGTAGELQWKAVDLDVGSRFDLTGDSNGDGKADFFLQVSIYDDPVTLSALQDCLLL